MNYLGLIFSLIKQLLLQFCQGLAPTTLALNLTDSGDWELSLPLTLPAEGLVTLLDVSDRGSDIVPDTPPTLLIL
jgi:hypothetical protein